jgi:pimeloyl-ACP methyl ester carboxylesterase
MSYPIHIYHSASSGKPTLLIGHGNGFPPEVYAPLVDALGMDHPAVCLPARPWWENAAPEDFTGWHMLADDLVGGIREHQLAPVIGIGHSMSGVAMSIAAVEHPDLFRAIILVDPVYIPRRYMWLTGVLRLLGIQPNAKLINGALRRQRQWDSLEEAYQRFRNRSLFQNCSDEVVWLYTKGITRPTSSGVELVYPPEWEAKIFSSVPVDEWRYPPRISVPCMVIGAEKTDVFFPPSVRLWQKMRPDIPVHVVPEAGHLLPMEKPSQVADLIRAFLVVQTNQY